MQTDNDLEAIDDFVCDVMVILTVVMYWPRFSGYAAAVTVCCNWKFTMKPCGVATATMSRSRRCDHTLGRP